MATAMLEKLGLVQQDPKVLLKEWQSKMRAEKRALERQIREIEREERKVQLEIKKLAAKGGQEASVKTLAKEIVQSRKATAKLHTAIANINSISMQMRTMTAQVTMGKTMQMSADVMKKMNKLMNTTETQNGMMELGREMQRAGFLQEMMDDAMALDDDVDDEVVDAEVEKVIAEATLSKLNNAPTLADKGRAAFQQSLGEDEEEEEVEEDNPEIANLERRLKNLA
jgi:charged multivesicular body protein 3